MTIPKFDYLIKDAGKIYGVELATAVWQDSRMTVTSPTKRFIVPPHDLCKNKTYPVRLPGDGFSIQNKRVDEIVPLSRVWGWSIWVKTQIAGIIVR